MGTYKTAQKLILGGTYSCSFLLIVAAKISEPIQKPQFLNRPVLIVTVSQKFLYIFFRLFCRFF